MNKNVKFTLRLLSFPLFTMLFMGSINILSHKIRLISIKTDMRNCIIEYSKLIKDKKLECNESLCSISLSPELEIKLDNKREECINIENKYMKAFNNMPIKF